MLTDMRLLTSDMRCALVRTTTPDAVTIVR
jgi:hypothetical protein